MWLACAGPKRSTSLWMCGCSSRNAASTSALVNGCGSFGMLPSLLDALRLRAALQQVGQLGDVRGDPPRLIVRQQLGRGAPARLILEIHIGKRLAVRVAHGEARMRFINGPGRRESAMFRHLRLF